MLGIAQGGVPGAFVVLVLGWEATRGLAPATFLATTGVELLRLGGVSIRNLSHPTGSRRTFRTRSPMASRCASAWVGTAESKELSPESVCGTATASAGTAGAGAEVSSAVLLPKDAVPEEDDMTERNWRKGNTRSQLARALRPGTYG